LRGKWRIWTALRMSTISFAKTWSRLVTLSLMRMG
jgi:hypothetical protein